MNRNLWIGFKSLLQIVWPELVVLQPGLVASLYLISHPPSLPWCLAADFKTKLTTPYISNIFLQPQLPQLVRRWLASGFVPSTELVILIQHGRPILVHLALGLAFGGGFPPQARREGVGSSW